MVPDIAPDDQWIDVVTLVVPRMTVSEMVPSLFENLDRTGLKLRWVVHVDPIPEMMVDMDPCLAEVKRLSERFDDSNIVVSSSRQGQPGSFFNAMLRTLHPCLYVEDDKVFIKKLDINPFLDGGIDYANFESHKTTFPSTITGFWSRRAVEHILNKRGTLQRNLEVWTKKICRRKSPFKFNLAPGDVFVKDIGCKSLAKHKLVRLFLERLNPVYVRVDGITAVVWEDNLLLESMAETREKRLCIDSFPVIEIRRGDNLDLNRIETPFVFFISSDAYVEYFAVKKAPFDKKRLDGFDLFCPDGDPMLYMMGRTSLFRSMAEHPVPPGMLVFRAYFATRLGKINKSAPESFFTRGHSKRSETYRQLHGEDIMHPNSSELMKKLVEKYLACRESISVLDIGSLDVNGTYKPIFDRPGWKYAGLDIRAGKNVDIVADEEWSQVEDDSYDVVISGQCLEHVKMPWKWSKHVFRVCKPDGICIIIAPWSFREHRFPIDCWRILPDGMTVLMAEWAGFETVECSKKDADTYFVGRKP